MSSGDSSSEKKTVFDCSVCFKSFRSKFSMRRHFKVLHQGIHSHICECGKSFGTKDQYQSHFVAKHSKQKLIQCARGCDKVFTTSSARYYHYKTFHDQIRSHCTFEGCNRSFVSAQILERHIQSVHVFDCLADRDHDKREEVNIELYQEESIEIETVHQQERELEEWEKMIQFY